MQNSLISIVMPVYNASAFLESSLHNLQKQSYENIEIVIVNDGSTDSSEEIIKKVTDEDSRFKYFKTENLGVSHARNYGLSKITGDYVCFVDSDDVVDKNMIKENYELLCKHKASTVINDCYYYNDKIKSYIPVIDEDAGVVPERKIYSYLLKDDRLNPIWLFMYSTKVIKDNNIKFPEDVFFGEDIIFNLRYFDSDTRLCYSKNAYYSYFINNGSGCRHIHENHLQMYDKQIKYKEKMFNKWKIANPEIYKGFVTSTAINLCSFAMLANNEFISREFSLWIRELFNSYAYCFVLEHKEAIVIADVHKTFKLLIKFLLNKQLIALKLYLRMVNFLDKLLSFRPRKL